MSLTVTTTSGERFTEAQSCELAWLIYLRFGREVAAAAEAWRRMLLNSCTDAQYARLVRKSSSFDHSIKGSL